MNFAKSLFKRGSPSRVILIIPEPGMASFLRSRKKRKLSTVRNPLGLAAACAGLLCGQKTHFRLHIFVDSME
jgi:hypothetical protein